MRMHQPGYCSVVFRVLGDFGDARQAVGWRKMKISTDCNIHGRTRDTGKKKCGSCDTERKKIMLNNNTLCVAGHPSKICTSRFSYCADTSNPSRNSSLTHPHHLSVLLLGDSEPSQHNIDSAQTMPSTRLPSPLFLSPSLPFSWPPHVEAMPPLPPLNSQSWTDQASGTERQASHPRLQCLGLGGHSCLSCANEFNADGALGGDGSIAVWSIPHPPSSSHDNDDH